MINYRQENIGMSYIMNACFLFLEMSETVRKIQKKTIKDYNKRHIFNRDLVFDFSSAFFLIIYLFLKNFLKLLKIIRF